MPLKELTLPVSRNKGWVRVWWVSLDEQVSDPKAKLRAQIHQLLEQEAARAACLNPASIRISRDFAGRPKLGGLPVGYACSMSYRGQFGLVALGFGLRVGVALEPIAPDFDWRPVAKTYFAISEVDQLARCENELRCREVFFRLCARKEAIAKAQGQGMKLLQKGVPLTPAACLPKRLETWTDAWAGHERSWLCDLPLREPLVGSVAGF